MGFIKEPPEEEKEEAPASDAVLDVRESPKPPSYDLPVTMEKLYHQPHLETSSMLFGARPSSIAPLKSDTKQRLRY